MTVLGDPVLVLVLAALMYWFGAEYDLLTREDGLRVFLVTVTVLAVVTATKHYFGLPRPPSPSIAYTAEGFGFPSGHTTAATGFYGVVAIVGTWCSRRWRTWIAGGVIGVVGFTRLVLGVHYVVDVVAGVVAGVLVIAIVLGVTKERLWPGFGVAVIVGVVAAALTGLDPVAVMAEDAAVSLGGTVGAAVAWSVIDRRGAGLATPEWPEAVGGGLVAGLPLGWVLVNEAGPTLTMVVAGVAGAVVVGVPAFRTFRGIGRVPTD